MNKTDTVFFTLKTNSIKKRLNKTLLNQCIRLHNYEGQKENKLIPNSDTLRRASKTLHKDPL